MSLQRRYPMQPGANEAASNNVVNNNQAIKDGAAIADANIAAAATAPTSPSNVNTATTGFSTMAQLQQASPELYHQIMMTMAMMSQAMLQESNDNYLQQMREEREEDGG